MKEDIKKTLHVALIMDGNGRWATQQGKPRLFGHAAGAQTLLQIVRACPDAGIATLTVFAFAIANWKRDKVEVDGLWVLFEKFLTDHLQELIAGGVRLVVIGDKAGLPAHVRSAVEQAEGESSANTKLLLHIALNYDGVDEVARMVTRALSQSVLPSDVSARYIREHLDTDPDNEPDIIIRTGMEQAKDGMALWRSSGFLLIQASQSVCVSSEVLWPDFTFEDLKKGIAYADPDGRLLGGQRASV